MNRHLHVVPVPVSREPVSLRSVERALADLRRGRPVAVSGGGGAAALVLAAEACTQESLRALREVAEADPTLVLTARRASVARAGKHRPASRHRLLSRGCQPPRRCTRWPIRCRCLRRSPWRSAKSAKLRPSPARAAAVLLAKTARLLPAAMVAPIRDPDADDVAKWASRHGLLWVDAGDVFQYDFIAARTLKPVSEARVPLLGAENAKIIAFRPLDGGLEHLAVMLGDPQPPEPVLTRLHSECFTGDLLGQPAV